MRKHAFVALFTAVVVLLSYDAASAQIVDKAKEVTKDVASTTKVIVTDGLEKTEDGAKKAAKVGASKTQKFGETVVNVTEDVGGQAYEGGKYYTHTTWDGTKWVSKRVWHSTKKEIVGESGPKP